MGELRLGQSAKYKYMIQGIPWVIVGGGSSSKARLAEFALHALYGGHRLVRTVLGATTVEHAGRIHFERVNGGTRLDWWPSSSVPTPKPNSMRISCE